MKLNWRATIVWCGRTWARVAPAARVLLLGWALCVAAACATAQQAAPTAPCQAWVAAQASWGALDAYVKGQIEQQRVLACYPPAPPPPPAPQQPAEPTPPPPVAPPPPQALPGLLLRQE